MKRNSHKKTRQRNFKPLAVIIFLFIVSVIFFKASARFMGQSDFFKIKKISYPKTVGLPAENSVFNLMGKNLFSVNLKEVSRKFRQEFPNLSAVRIYRHLPDELIIEAQKRSPVALVKLGEKYFYVDSEAVIISNPEGKKDNLPVILGVANRPSSIKSGQLYDDQDLKFGLEIIQELAKIPYLNKLVLTKIKVSGASRASFLFASGIEVIIGQERLKEKLQLLLIVYSRLGAESAQVKYIDLRFKEPVIGKKP